MAFKNVQYLILSFMKVITIYFLLYFPNWQKEYAFTTLQKFIPVDEKKKKNSVPRKKNKQNCSHPL